MSEKQIALFRESLQKQISVIDKAIEDIDRGKNADLGRMENNVSTLCTNIILAGKETGMALENDMKTMISRLDMLEMKLNARKYALMSQMEDK